MSRRITVRAMIVRDGKLFAVRHKDSSGNTSDFWCTPGGGLDDKESLEAGIARELLEETGVTAQVGRLVYIQQFAKTEVDSYEFDEFLEFFFLIDNPTDFDNINLEMTTHGAHELAEFSWIDPAAVNFLPTFLQSIDLAELTTKNSPVIITSEL